MPRDVKLLEQVQQVRGGPERWENICMRISSKRNRCMVKHEASTIIQDDDDDDDDAEFRYLLIYRSQNSLQDLLN